MAWWQILIAVAIGFFIWRFGTAMVKSVTGGGPRETTIEPEDVDDLEVFFVCTECGTEYQITRLGKLSVPRHCGEPMEVVRRPKPDPSLN